MITPRSFQRAIELSGIDPRLRRLWSLRSGSPPSCCCASLRRHSSTVRQTGNGLVEPFLALVDPATGGAPMTGTIIPW